MRGELRVHPYFDGSDTLLKLGSVLIEMDGRPPVWMRLESARRITKGILVKIAGIDSREAARPLHGALVAVARKQLPEPSEGECYLVDLVGAKVSGPSGEVGRVIEVRAHPGADTALILTPDGRLLEQVLNGPWVEHIDTEVKLIRLSSTDGLIE